MMDSKASKVDQVYRETKVTRVSKELRDIKDGRA